LPGIPQSDQRKREARKIARVNLWVGSRTRFALRE
jgi:hypothetical protein